MPTGTPHNLPLIIGHRGASQDAPENTLESFRLAWDQGADGIEADFRLTADGRIIGMHDATTGRTTGLDLNVAGSTLDDLRRLDAGLWKGAVWSGAMIPTLEEVLAALPSGSWFFIEIKSGPEIIATLGKVLQASGRTPERIRLLSFNADLITEFKRRLPDWHVCWLCDYRHSLFKNARCSSRTDIIDILRRSGADGLASADRTMLDRGLVDMIKGLDKEIHIWTVDHLPAAQRLCSLQVDSIMTNRPGWLRQKLTAGSDQSYAPLHG